MHSRLLFPLLLILFFLALPKSIGAQLPADTLPLPTQWSTHYLILLHNGPKAEDQSPEAVQALRDHIQFQLRLQEAGTAIAAGGLAPEPGSELVGVTLLRTASLEEAEGIAAADPGVRFGRFRVEVRPWYTPSGRLP